jgi:hypothetical protein
LRKLDEFEGVPDGLYRRAPIPLVPPFDSATVDAYFPVQDPTAGRDLGETWVE